MVASTRQLVDQYGHALRSTTANDRVAMLRTRLRESKREMMQARFDAAQTFEGNENHWANADHLDPHGAASLVVRRKLRSRSRYEVIENNPFLKGTIITIANDFVGTTCPKLRITDKRLPAGDRRERVEERFRHWAKRVFLRQKLWRMRVAKIVDGETFMRAYLDTRTRHPVKLNLQVLECDRISSQPPSLHTLDAQTGEVDGVRFDPYEVPLEYHVLFNHPGNSAIWGDIGRFDQAGMAGEWINAEFMVHWFRQDRGWLRGIPETVTSLPLCSILRRYTLAMVRHAETQADLTAIIETEGPPSQNPFTDSAGGTVEDDPFETFPMAMGMIMNLPWGYKLKQLEATPLGAQYDQFVGSVLREITRPILVPFNLTSGTSKDSNMASAVVDQHIYNSGQACERSHCEENVLDKVFELWWFEASRIPNHFGDRLTASFRDDPPEHEWGWTKVGLDHTDPSKVATALNTLHDMKVMTDRDIQERYFNRDKEAWQEEVKQDEEFRQGLPSAQFEREQAMAKAQSNDGPPGSDGKANGKPPTNGKGKSNSRVSTLRNGR